MNRVRWYWQLVAWVVAVPLGFLLSAWPAYGLGIVSKDDLLNIFVGAGIGRFVRLVIVAFVWALLVALLVQAFVEIGRVRLSRYRRARAATRMLSPVSGVRRSDRGTGWRDSGAAW